MISNAPLLSCAPLAAGQRFAINCSVFFTANMSLLPVDKFCSLQITNLNIDASNTLSFSDVEFLVSGTTTDTFSYEPITIWSRAIPPQLPSP